MILDDGAEDTELGGAALIDVGADVETAAAVEDELAGCSSVQVVEEDDEVLMGAAGG